jgi:hypothetical protein
VLRGRWVQREGEVGLRRVAWIEGVGEGEGMVMETRKIRVGGRKISKGKDRTGRG